MWGEPRYEGRSGRSVPCSIRSNEGKVSNMVQSRRIQWDPIDSIGYDYLEARGYAYLQKSVKDYQYRHAILLRLLCTLSYITC
jgi:hypothetical protein